MTPLVIQQLDHQGWVSRLTLESGPWLSLGAFAPREPLYFTEGASDWLARMHRRYGWRGVFRAVNSAGDVLLLVRFGEW